MNIVISSGHAKLVRGASGYIDEVDEARRVVDEVVRCLAKLGVDARPFHDDTSSTQSENLETIVDFHNNHIRDLDVSVHFNAYTETEKPMGCEVLYLTQAGLASDLSNAMAKFAGFVNRGAKKRTDLYFLNNTEEAAVLLEVCFVDSAADVELYKDNFEVLCRAIAVGLSGRHFIPDGIPDNQTGITASVFGGESDYNVSAYDEAKVLNDEDLYVALPDRFEGYRPRVIVYNRESGSYATAEIWDVGPWNIDDPYWDKGTRPQAETGTDMSGRTTNKAGIDLSPALASMLSIDGMGTVDWEFEEEE